MSARGRIENVWSRGFSVKPYLDAYRVEILEEAAAAIRAAAPKYLDDPIDEHVFHVLDTLASKIASGDLS